MRGVMRDISPDFRLNQLDSEVAERLIRFDKTPRAIRIFSNERHKLSDYGYWFFLGTLWVGYTGWSDLNLWKKLFASNRPRRETSLMKPSELAVWRELPEVLTAYRAHRPNETDWISYAIDPQKAGEFAMRRGVDRISEYRIRKSDAVAIFLRRGETELIVLDKSRAEFVREVMVIVPKAGAA